MPDFISKAMTVLIVKAEELLPLYHLVGQGVGMDLGYAQCEGQLRPISIVVLGIDTSCLS